MRKSIRTIIYNEYLKAALLPILLVEVLLLIMYFSITNYVEAKTEETLLSEAKYNILEIVSREGKSITQQINEISNLATILQIENSYVISNPEKFNQTGIHIQLQKAETGSSYKLDDNGGSSVWYSAITTMTPTTQEKVNLTEAMDISFKAITGVNTSIVGIYFNAFDSMCRYYPFLPEVYNVFEPTMDIPTFNFYYLADEVHNPTKGPVWTDAYLDPAGQGWLASCIVPIYNASGFLEGVTGIDITIDSILSTILDLKLPWEGSAFLIDQNGVILAMPESIESILNLKELRQQVYDGTIKSDTLKPEAFNLFKNEDNLILNQIRTIYDNKTEISDFNANGNDYYLAQSIIGETNWRMMVLVKKDIILASAYKLKTLTLQTGYLAFALMVLFYSLFFSYLLFKSKKVANNIAKPIVDIAESTSSMIQNLQSFDFQGRDTNIEEIHLLTHNFARMSTELNAVYTGLEEIVEKRTHELQDMYASLQESNIGLENEIVVRKKTESLLETKKNELEKAYIELKQANNQMIQQEKMASIGQLAAGVAHEINNPMGFVISNIDTLEDYTNRLLAYISACEQQLDAMSQCLRDDQVHSSEDSTIVKKSLGIDTIKSDIGELFSDTIEGTTRIKNIVQELRAFTRNETTKSMTDINKSIDSVINILWNELKYVATVDKQYSELPLTYCSSGQLNQVFMNLILNAVQAIHDKGTIIIKTFLKDKNIIVEIIDNGEGILEENMTKIFDPFFTTKEIGKGTGLGLSISYEIMKSHGGNLTCVSTHGEGATFTVIIPIVEDYES